MRLMRFQFSLMRRNDWLNVQDVLCAVIRVELKLLLFCTGTLIRLAMGFCAAFCNALEFAAAAGVSSVATWSPACHRRILRDRAAE